MIYCVTHKTTYSYRDEVAFCHNQAYLSPRNSPYQICHSSEVWVSPLPALMHQRNDFFGNNVHYFAVQTPHRFLTVTAISKIETVHPGTVPLPRHSPPWESVRRQLRQTTTAEGLEARGYVLDSLYTQPFPELLDYARVSFTPQRPILDAVRDLMARIFNEFTYDPHFTTLVTPLAEVLRHRRGVCQDFAHLVIACLRGLGLAARYVSGYIETLPPPGQTKLVGTDASHAWLAVYVPEQGWTDFDPTNNQIPMQQHITTAWGRDYNDVAPLKGVIFGGGGHTLEVSVDVAQLE